MDKINKDNFIWIPESVYTIGLSMEVMETALHDASSSGIKKEFLLNSWPCHQVHLKDVLISKRLVTVSEFENFVRETGYLTEAEKEGWGWVMESSWTRKEGVSWRNPFGNGEDLLYPEYREKLPVSMVTWNDADNYCRWLTERGCSARLPSEYEWEIFAERVKAPSLEKIQDIIRREKHGESESYFEILLNEISRDGSFHRPGILWEWTENWFEAYPEGPENKEFGETYKVLRGGSAASVPLQRAREYRFRRCPTARSPFYGFRIASDSV